MHPSVAFLFSFRRPRLLFVSFSLFGVQLQGQFVGFCLSSERYRLNLFNIKNKIAHPSFARKFTSLNADSRVVIHESINEEIAVINLRDFESSSAKKSIEVWKEVKEHGKQQPRIRIG